MALFLVVYHLNYDGPYFSPNLNVNSEPNFTGLITDLLEDIIEMGSYLDRIDTNYPPYNVINKSSVAQSSVKSSFFFLICVFLIYYFRKILKKMNR